MQPDRSADRRDQTAEYREAPEFIEDAAKQGVQILCMQEIFTTPYFCAEQQTRWYEAVERIPDGPTVRLMQEVAKEHGMVIIVPIYEKNSPASTTPPQ